MRARNCVAIPAEPPPNNRVLEANTEKGETSCRAELTRCCCAAGRAGAMHKPTWNPAVGRSGGNGMEGGFAGEHQQAAGNGARHRNRGAASLAGGPAALKRRASLSLCHDLLARRAQVAPLFSACHCEPDQDEASVRQRLRSLTPASLAPSSRLRGLSV